MANPAFLKDGFNNRFAIMTNGAGNNVNDPAFVSPLSHLGSFKFHSALDFLGIAKTLTASTDLVYTTFTGVNGTKAIATHGLGYTPVLMGYVTTATGARLPITGDFMINGSGANGGSIGKFNVFADATNVYMLAQPGFTNSEIISFTIYACNMGIDGAGNLVRPPLFNGFSYQSGRIRCGRFDTNYGFFNRNASGLLRLYRGKSMDLQVGTPISGAGYCVLGYTLNLPGYLVNGAGTTATPNNVGGSTTPATFPGTVNAGGNPLFTPTQFALSANIPSGKQALSTSSGRIQLGTVFDTNNPAFIITNYVNATATVPDLAVGTVGAITSTQVFNLAAVNSLASDVLGLVQYTYSGLGATYTRSIGGTIIMGITSYRMQPAIGWYAQYATGLSWPSAARFFYLQISGGYLQLVYQLMLPQPTGGFTVPGATINVKALVGTFNY